MSKRPISKLFAWRVTRIIGYVEAPDAEQAIRAAISLYEISNPHEQARLAAQRVREVG